MNTLLETKRTVFQAKCTEIFLVIHLWTEASKITWSYDTVKQGFYVHGFGYLVQVRLLSAQISKEKVAENMSKMLKGF